MNNARILIIDDEPQIRRLLEITLENSDYKVLLAENGKQGILLAANHNPDLILLDLGLPDQSGHDVLRELRLWYQKPVFIISALDQEAEVVKALDQGANDYLTKPFRTAELQARIRSALRSQQSTNGATVYTSGELEVDLTAHTVKKAGEFIKLTVTEFALLALLIKNEGRVLTHQFILKEIWGVGAQTETQYLRVFVGTLRKKIESNSNKPEHILTESGVGYRFV